MKDVVDITYIRPTIIEDLRAAAVNGKRLNKSQRQLLSDAAAEISELREFCTKNGQVIARLMREIAAEALCL